MNLNKNVGLTTDRLRSEAQKHYDIYRSLLKAANIMEGKNALSGLTRFEDIKDLLIKNGPMRGCEFIAYGIPSGSVSQILKSKPDFVKNGMVWSYVGNDN